MSQHDITLQRHEAEQQLSMLSHSRNRNSLLGVANAELIVDIILSY